MATPHRPRACALLLCVAVAAAALLSVASASRFRFSLPSRAEECFMESVDARSSDNKLLFRFGLIEPEYYDVMDVTIISPHGRLIDSWNRTQAAHVTTAVRENGLYKFCFRKLAGASRVINVYYSFDFISSGSRHVVLYPNIAGTLDRAAPTATAYSAMSLSTKDGQTNKMGAIEFSLRGTSASIVHSNTRVQLLISVESILSGEETAGISIATFPKRLEFPVSWSTVGEDADQNFNTRVFDSAEAELGSHLTFDVTELFDSALSSGQETLAFTLHADDGTEVALMGIANTPPDYYPQLVVEDIGLDLMHEVAYFKQRVFELRGEITYIRQKERHSRNAAESANGRVKWLSLLTNVVLVGIAAFQVLYIRSLLESSY